MFCPNCGERHPEGTKFCSSCGGRLTEAARNQPQSPEPQPSFQQPAPQQPSYIAPAFEDQFPDLYQDLSKSQTPDLPMKWFRFLIWFALFAGSVLNAISGIQLLTGANYGELGDKVYMMFPLLKKLDLIMGCFAIGLGIFGIFTRFQLSGYKSSGPACLTWVYVGGILFNVLYTAGSVICMKYYGMDITSLELTSVISSVCTSAAMIIINKIYFNKRSHLFVN